MGQGFVPAGQFEDLLNLIRQAAAASERAMNAAKYAEHAASAAGVAGQQAVVRAINMVNTPGITTMSPFSAGQPTDTAALASATQPSPASAEGLLFAEVAGGLIIETMSGEDMRRPARLPSVSKGGPAAIGRRVGLRYGRRVRTSSDGNS